MDKKSFPTNIPLYVGNDFLNLLNFYIHLNSLYFNEFIFKIFYFEYTYQAILVLGF